MDKTLRDGAIGRAEALLSAGDAVVDVEPPAAPAAEQSIPLLHSMSSGDEAKAVGLGAVSGAEGE